MRKTLCLSTAVLCALVFTAMAGAEAKIGESAPDFSLTDQNGKTVSLADFKGKIVVLEWFNNDCPYVQRHYKSHTMANLAEKYSPKDVVWLAINSTNGKTPDDDKAIASEWNIKYS